MKISLKNFDQQIDRETLEWGADLFEMGVVELHAIEKSLWHSRIKDGDEFVNAELYFVGSVAQEMNCSCERFHAKKCCEHIAATLWAIRRKKEQAREANLEAVANKKKAAPKITTLKLIERVPAEELKSFLREYLKRDKVLARAVKVQFAYLIEEFSSPFEKYDALLKQIILEAIKKKYPLPKAAVKAILQQTQKLQEQAAVHILIENYREALGIIQAIIINVTPYFQHWAAHQEAIIALLDQSWGLFKEVLQKKIAPELHDEVWNFCTTTCNDTRFLHHFYFKEFYNTMLLMAKNEHKLLLEILPLAIQQSQNSKISEAIRATAWAYKMSVLEGLNDKIALSNSLSEHNFYLEGCLFCINQLAENKTFHAAHQWLRLLEKQGIPLASQRDFLETQLNLALIEKNQENIVKHTTTLFCNTYASKYFDILKKYARQDTWKEDITAIIEQLFKEENIKPIDKENLLEILYSEGIYESVLSVLEEQQNIFLLTKFDTNLLPLFPERYFVAYEGAITNYLSNYHSVENYQKVSSILYRLKKINDGKYFKALLEYVRNNFSTRLILLQMLRDL